MPKLAEYSVHYWYWDNKRYEVYKRNDWRTTSSQIAVDSADWFHLLKQIPSFSFTGRSGRFTVRKEKRRNSVFWYGFTRTKVGTRKIYIGKTEELTMERLEDKVKALYNKVT